MARTHAWILYHDTPEGRNWLARFWAWCLARLGRSPIPLTGPVETAHLSSLAAALEQRLGKRYLCLRVSPRPGPTLDEALRELLQGDRVILVPPLLTDARAGQSVLKRAARVLVDRPNPHAALSTPSIHGYIAEAEAWSQRMHCIACLKAPSADEPQAEVPAPFSSPDLHQALAEGVQEAERSAGWMVPEDWIREAVARAWDAIDGGQSVEDATTLPEQVRPRLAWVDDFLRSTEEAEQEDA